ncbi:unnamed protein product [Danaus chrysippus]|uniref:(African queen) hypothetical protein n=1 Tax=Danaus chrysippus TaxID=151541 RepID=A0A8J2WF60_9NEOP|nr:unnamed protein product [Danaus chrysippus]
MALATQKKRRIFDAKNFLDRQAALARVKFTFKKKQVEQILLSYIRDGNPESFMSLMVDLDANVVDRDKNKQETIFDMEIDEKDEVSETLGLLSGKIIWPLCMEYKDMFKDSDNETQYTSLKRKLEAER